MAVPKLRYLSDVIYFQWLQACEAKDVPPSNLKVIFRSHVRYKPSFDIVQKALQDLGREIPEWHNRVTLSTDTPQGLAILGTSHGSSTALLLIQPKAKLGLKGISHVTVWGHRENTAKGHDVRT
ncbi:hypothetical protein CTA2_3855 [Colletotrichum tanaceti]|uniref:Uncharacterized protein n=1 Tax=Colletotrichum tanaceti TaxID=1306861 RepID=A0A4U6X4L3_9PEZI|nr:hypothetical protein CTA2_3855 [Colletotrichum tanaceti]TKW49739.1 hypothetical protein CTA1_11168 [Colletotrichum tanaceti]